MARLIPFALMEGFALELYLQLVDVYLHIHMAFALFLLIFLHLKTKSDANKIISTDLLGKEK